MRAADSRIRGHMLLVVRSADGGIVAQRQSDNMVVRGGARIVAMLFTGANGATPINQIQMGFARDSGTTELAALTQADPPIPVSALRSPLKPEDFQIVTDHPDEIQVRITSVFHPSLELTDVTEAGLLAGEALYNQVVFEPISLHTNHDITFFWQVNFPFGH
jgi:hypothetical protein